MQIDIQAGAPPARTSPPIEFIRIELAPLAQGGVSLLVKSTVFDETELDFLDQEIATGRVNSLDEAFALIREHVHFATPLQ
jgi:hypothetical protein